MSALERSILSEAGARALTDEAAALYHALPADVRAEFDANAPLLPEAKLADLEGVIERGLEIFVEVGQALAEIRNRKLYALSHETFEVYCRERWGFSKRHANRLVQSADVVAQVGPIGPTPTTESQARELAPLLDQPDTLREAWAEVIEQHPEPTAAHVREVVERKRGPVMVMPLNEDLVEKQQRENLISALDRAVFALEAPPDAAQAQAQQLLADGDAGPFTPSRFERVAAYSQAFAVALREAGIDG